MGTFQLTKIDTKILKTRISCEIDKEEKTEWIEKIGISKYAENIYLFLLTFSFQIFSLAKYLKYHFSWILHWNLNAIYIFLFPICVGLHILKTHILQYYWISRLFCSKLNDIFSIYNHIHVAYNFLFFDSFQITILVNVTWWFWITMFQLILAESCFWPKCI